MSSFTLRARLVSLAAAGALGTVVVGASGLWGMHRTTEAARSLVTINAMQRSQMTAATMRDAILADVYAALLAARAKDATRRDAASSDLAAHSRRLQEQLVTIEAQSTGQQLLRQLRTTRSVQDGFLASAHDALQQTTGDTAAAHSLLPQLEQSYAQLRGAMDGTQDLIDDAARLEAQRTEEQWSGSPEVLGFAVLGILLLATLAAIATTRAIAARIAAVTELVGQLRKSCIQELKDALDGMARGDLTLVLRPRTRMLVVEGTDEIAVLTTSVNDVLQQLQHIIAAFEEARGNVGNVITESARLAAAANVGHLGERGDEQAFAGSYRDLVHGMNQMLDAVIAPVNNAAAVLVQLARQDLSARVRGEYRGDHARIQQALNTALDTLSATLRAVADTAAGVATSAQQIDAGSKELALGAGDQATSLEEVAASARELATVTKRNAASAAEGRSLADSARASAGEGVVEVRRLAEAIARIKMSSEATAKIVKTIDEIAFQTNLLALNAAVEAARAGDSGRGFAVVADEVRSLAMRSAEAAKHTAHLIEESVRSTEQGVHINSEMLSKLSEIDDRVNRVGQVVTEIAVASDEQARGVELIDRALEDMTRRTQGVAAAAEESEKASRELASQSSTLRELVGGFELGRGPGYTAPVGEGGTAAVRGSARAAARHPKSGTSGDRTPRSSAGPVNPKVVRPVHSKSVGTSGAVSPGGVRGKEGSKPSPQSVIPMPMDDEDWDTAGSF